MRLKKIKWGLARWGRPSIRDEEGRKEDGLAVLESLESVREVSEPDRHALLPSFFLKTQDEGKVSELLTVYAFAI